MFAARNRQLLPIAEASRPKKSADSDQEEPGEGQGEGSYESEEYEEDFRILTGPHYWCVYCVYKFISYKSSHVSKLFASAPTGQGIIVLNLSHDARYISTDSSI